jgi:hypothetical protein
MRYYLKYDFNMNFFHRVSFVLFSQRKNLLPTFMKKFIHCNLSSTISFINIIHPWTCEKIFFHITKYFVLSAEEYFKNILSMWEEYFKKDSVLVPCSCSHPCLTTCQYMHVAICNVHLKTMPMCTQKLGNMHVTMCKCIWKHANVHVTMSDLSSVNLKTWENQLVKISEHLVFHTKPLWIMNGLWFFCLDFINISWLQI